MAALRNHGFIACPENHRFRNASGISQNRLPAESGCGHVIRGTLTARLPHLTGSLLLTPQSPFPQSALALVTPHFFATPLSETWLLDFLSH